MAPKPSGRTAKREGLLDGDELDPGERAQLHASIEEGLDDSEADRVITAADSLKELRALRCASK